MAMSDCTPKDIARFWAKVARTDTPDECWLWTAARNGDGYGLVGWRGKANKAHRISWMLTYGGIPDNLCVLHNCPNGDNPACVNPAHLWLGTQLDNARDREQKDRGNHATGLRSGSYTHPEKVTRGSRHALAKLTEVNIPVICQRYAEGGITMAELGEEYGVSKQVIWSIVHHKHWRHAL